MLEISDPYYLIDSLKLFLRIMFVFICFSSIILLVAPSIFGKIVQRLQQRHGVKREFLPWFEGDKVVLDHFLYKHRKIIGTLAITISIILFIVFR
ncbi:MAG: hypothetical protein ISS47_09500 [Candidatus Omnitrophica bacterium]|nr:hypothetical protein [Candidatus Omnitrophota bacterium]